MPVQKTITAKRVVAVLNEALMRDPLAINALINNRVPTRDDSTGLQSPTSPIQVGLDEMVGVLGLINGFFGSNSTGYGTIVAEYHMDCDGNPALPLQIACFRLLEKPKPKTRKKVTKVK